MGVLVIASSFVNGFDPSTYSDGGSNLVMTGRRPLRNYIIVQLSLVARTLSQGGRVPTSI